MPGILGSVNKLKTPALLAFSASAAIALAACGSSKTEASTNVAVTTPAAVADVTSPELATDPADVAETEAAAPAPAPAPAAAATEAPAVATAGKVSANDATVDEIAAALESAGVSNATKWAHEIEEYRPYPADDPTFAKLRDELAKYNPGDGVVDQIVAVLQP